MGLAHFDDTKEYIGFADQTSVRLRDLHELVVAASHRILLVEDDHDHADEPSEPLSQVAAPEGNAPP
jgi:hypothetical protein